MLLVGDIGGTKVHLAIFDGDRIVKEEKFPSRHYQNFSEILEKFLDRLVEQACFAIAGPVRQRSCKMTNLVWEIDADILEKRHKIKKVDLINDLEAAGWGLQKLKPEDLVTLNRGEKQNGNQAIVAAGTGLGIGALFWNGKYHVPFATEGGHVEFGPRSASEKQLWDYLHKKYGHVSVERVVSGPGLEHLYWFLVETGKYKKIPEAEDLAKEIIKQADSPVCQEAVRWFAALYGAAAGNAALQYLAHGGIYLAGGIAPKITPFLKEGEFMRAFVDKGRFQSLLEKIPVYLVLNEKLALLGALSCCKAD